MEDYEKATGKSLRLERSRSMDEIMNETEGLSNKFKDFRDDKSKVAKVRTALKNNMWLIKKIVNTVQAVGNVASVSLEITAARKWTYRLITVDAYRPQAFPPAMPASLIFSAFGQVTQVRDTQNSNAV